MDVVLKNSIYDACIIIRENIFWEPKYDLEFELLTVYAVKVFLNRNHGGHSFTSLSAASITVYLCHTKSLHDCLQSPLTAGALLVSHEK